MTERTNLQRKFRMGATVLDDVNPAWTPEQVLGAYIPNYPFLAQATLSEAKVEGQVLFYDIVKPAAQTKGSVSPMDAIEQKIAAWADAPVAQPSTMGAWHGVMAIIDRRLNDTNPAQGLFDPLYVPMA